MQITSLPLSFSLSLIISIFASCNYCMWLTFAFFLCEQKILFPFRWSCFFQCSLSLSPPCTLLYSCFSCHSSLSLSPSNFSASIDSPIPNCSPSFSLFILYAHDSSAKGCKFASEKVKWLPWVFFVTFIKKYTHLFPFYFFVFFFFLLFSASSYSPVASNSFTHPSYSTVISQVAFILLDTLCTISAPLYECRQNTRILKRINKERGEEGTREKVWSNVSWRDNLMKQPKLPLSLSLSLYLSACVCHVTTFQGNNCQETLLPQLHSSGRGAFFTLARVNHSKLPSTSIFTSNCEEHMNVCSSSSCTTHRDTRMLVRCSFYCINISVTMKDM